MRALDLINHMVPPLKMEDSIAKGHQWLQELRLAELPVVENEKFLGIVSEDIILSGPDFTNNISDLPLDGTSCFVYESQHYFDVLKVAHTQNKKIVAVLNEFNHYLGVITTEDLIDAFANTSSVTSPGAILVISTNSRDYHLSEISRLIESTDSNVIGVFVSSNAEDPSMIELTLKINREETSYAISILEANGYKVLESYSEAPPSMHDQQRLDELMNFLKL